MTNDKEGVWYSEGGGMVLNIDSSGETTLQQPKTEIDTKELFFTFQRGRGRCVILTYRDFSTKSGPNYKDISLVDKTFKDLNFEVNLYESRYMSIKRLQQRIEIDPDIDILITFVFGNGHPKEVVDRQELFDVFASKSIKEIPKILFLLGTNNMEDFDSDDTDEDYYSSCSFAKMRGNTNSMVKSENFLHFYSNSVSKTLETLCFEFKQNSSIYDLNLMLSNVLQQVKQDADYRDKICYINSTLTRLVALKEIKQPKTVFEQMNSSYKTGFCYILYSSEMLSSTKARIKIKHDANRLKQFFDKIHFTVELENSSLSDEAKFLEQLYQKDYSSYDCFVMCYLSNESYSIYGDTFDRLESIDCDDLIRAMSLNKTLKDKPKICFLHACNDDINDFDANEIPAWNYSDLFVFSSNHDLSIRNRKTGPIFIKTLCEILEKYHKDFDLNTIATMVCKRICLNTEKFKLQEFCQMPFVHTTMTRPIKLNIIQACQGVECHAMTCLLKSTLFGNSWQEISQNSSTQRTQ